MAVMVPPKVHALAAPSLPQTFIKEMEEVFLRLGFSQVMVLKLVDDQGRDSPWTLVSLSDVNIATICKMICKPGRLVSRKTPDRGNQIPILAMKNLKLVTFMFQTMEHCSTDYRIKDVNSTSVLQHQHQWELEQKKPDDIKAPKIDKNNWAKNLENIVLHLKPMIGTRGTPLV